MVHWFLPVCPSVKHVEAYYSRLLKILWWNFGYMLNLVNILCDSIFKHLGQFKSLPLQFYSSIDQFRFESINKSHILLQVKCVEIWKFLHSERMVYFLFNFGGILYILFLDHHHSLDEENDRKHDLFLGLLLRNYRITDFAELPEFLIFF